LPALPDVWKEKGSIGGLRAIGGFEITAMEWRGGKLVKLAIRSTLGGNLRIRVPNEMKSMYKGKLKMAEGTNTNPFYYTEEGATPVISPLTHITRPDLKTTWLYDVSTQKGQLYQFLIKE
jgi:alpha-L-fucosidase 2